MDYDKLYDLWEKHGVVEYLKEEYRKEFSSWDWDIIENESEEIEDIYNNCIISSYYLGSVFSIMPSGKYYMPWACSHVSFKEVLKDEIFCEVLETEFLEPKGYYWESGEGDPCDLFICKFIRDIEEE